MIIVADTKVARRVGEYFIKHIIKLQEVSWIFSNFWIRIFKGDWKG